MAQAQFWGLFIELFFFLTRKHRMLHSVLLPGLCWAFWQADWQRPTGQGILFVKGDSWVTPGKPHQAHCPGAQEEENAVGISKLAEVQLWPSKTTVFFASPPDIIGKAEKAFKSPKTFFYILR